MKTRGGLLAKGREEGSVINLKKKIGVISLSVTFKGFL